MTAHEHGQRDNGYELVMPFVVVASKDGPYDDLAYAAGWEAGQIDLLLGHLDFIPGSKMRLPQAVRTDNTPQLDLIAMKHDLVASFDDAGDGWSWMLLEREAG